MKDKTTEDETYPPDGMIWCACDWGGAQVGFLVTEQNKIDRPIAFVSTLNFNEERALAVCRAIADAGKSEPWRYIDDIVPVPLIDLTPYAKPDSIAPMPAFIYALQLYRVDHRGNVDDEMLGVEPRPPCRFLFKDLKKQIKKNG